MIELIFFIFSENFSNFHGLILSLDRLIPTIFVGLLWKIEWGFFDHHFLIGLSFFLTIFVNFVSNFPIDALPSLPPNITRIHWSFILIEIEILIKLFHN